MKLATSFLLMVMMSNVFSSTGLEIKVKGMVCSFCTTGIEKKFKEQSEVENVVVDMDKSLVTVALKSDQSLSDDKIKELIESAGFNVAEILRK